MRLAAVLIILAVAIGAPHRAFAATFDLQYQASLLNVVTLGEAGLRGRVSERGYAATASVRTAGAAAYFDDTRIQASASGALGAASLAWSRYELSHNYARKFRRVTMRRQAGNVQADIAPPFRDMGTPPASPAQAAASLDPVSALVQLSRAVARDGACRARVAVFDGRGHYTLSLSAKSRGTYRGGGYSGPALVCALRYAPVAGFKPMSAADRARIPVGEIWFGSPEQGLAPPLRIEAPTPFGAPLRIDIRSRQISP